MQPRNPDMSAISGNRILWHVVFWFAILSYFTIGYARNDRYLVELIRSAVFLPNHMIMVYTFLYFLIPQFLLPRKFLRFFIFSALFYACGMYFSYFINYRILAPMGIPTYWSLGAALLGQFTVLGIAISIKLLKYWYQQKQQTLLAEKQKTEVELELLKSQIHPHFLFNTLNNLYAHTLTHSAQAPEIVLKLSSLLRFMIYESNQDYIPLKKELELLKQYTDLEKLRYGNRLDMSVSITGAVEDQRIAPLLLLPFLENAFKHGTSKQIDQCWISMDIHVEQNRLGFKLVNSHERNLHREATDVGGVGLENVRRRLDYLYPGFYDLHLSEDEEVFVVSLDLPLVPGVKKGEKENRNLIQQENAVKMFAGG